MRATAAFGLRLEEGMKKVAAIGIHVTANGISSHGFALNVDPDLNHFNGIIPCGIQEFGVTSMSEILGRSLLVTDVYPTRDRNSWPGHVVRNQL